MDNSLLKKQVMICQKGTAPNFAPMLLCYKYCYLLLLSSTQLQRKQQTFSPLSEQSVEKPLSIPLIHRRSPAQK